VGLNRGAAKFVKVIAKSADGTRTLTTSSSAMRIDPRRNSTTTARRNSAIRIAAARGNNQGGLNHDSDDASSNRVYLQPRIEQPGAILEKAAAYAEARRLDPAVLLNTRLIPDMLPLSSQIFIATISPARSRTPRRVEVPTFDGKDKTLPELIANTRRTIAYLGSLKPHQFDAPRTKRSAGRRAAPARACKACYLLNHVYPMCTSTSPPPTTFSGRRPAGR